MPVIEKSDYKAPFWAVGGHIQTILPALFRKVRKVHFRWEKILTPDGDFLMADWLLNGNNKLAVLSHGLEGNSQSGYILGMAKMLRENGFDVLAWNHRMCTGELNNCPKIYHSGNSEDLRTVINHVLAENKYAEIVLLGFSMGGNITLKYLGEEGDSIAEKIKKAVVFSVPVDLGAAGKQLEKRKNKVYLSRFLKSLKEKIRQKEAQFPSLFQNFHLLKNVNSFRDFDEYFTAPLHGFSGAEEYYRKSSSKQFIPEIKIPTLLVNALNDPFLAPECFPVNACKKSNFVYLEMPGTGGHVGFFEGKLNGKYWSEKRALQFLMSE